MPEGADRRPGRQSGLNRVGTHHAGAHDAIAWSVAYIVWRAESKRLVCTLGAVLWEPLFK